MRSFFIFRRSENERQYHPPFRRHLGSDGSHRQCGRTVLGDEERRFVFRLAVRIAREFHRPISEVLEYPTTEFNYWAVVFQEEYYEAHPKERFRDGMTECDCANEIEKFKKMMSRK